MVSIAQRYRGEAVLFGFFNPQLHGFMGNDLTEAGVTVKGGDGAGVFHHAGVTVKLQKSFAMGFYVTRDHADAV